MSLNLKPEDITPESVKEFFESIDTYALLKNIDAILAEIEKEEENKNEL